MKRTRRICVPTTALALAAVLMLFTGSANASGFRVPESSIAGLGTANALVANPEELGALVYNPAAMAFQKGNNIVAGVVVIEPDTKVSNAAGTSESDPDSPFFVPNLYFMTHFGDPWTFGLNISSPFGLETNWPAGAFPNFAGPLAGTQPTRTRVEMFNINPNFAYAVNDTISVAFGVDYYQVNKANLDSAAATVNGSGADWGWNAAMLYSKGRWSAGASYRSSVEVKIDGLADFRSLGSFAFGAELEIEFPDMLQIGARYKATDKLGIEFDIERTKWSTFDSLVITATSVAPPGTVLSTNVQNWDDVNAYRLGFTYQLSNKTQLRFGYTFDETPQPDATFTARVPDADRQFVSFGVKQRISTWDLEAGVMYVKWDDRTISNTTPIGAGDPNGTNAFNGNYDSTAILVGLGFGKSF
ncbi:MAG: OmpP1/FadL family transporter [Gammaproteobacteria bacterium]|nr:MAG: OmpP1/FadL family transporter [Gammaproteobacteria bacterium]